MLNDRQLEQVNQARAALGKHPINTQTSRQNPNIGADWLKFWTDYDDGKPPLTASAPTPPIVEAAGADDGKIVEDDTRVAYDDMTIDELKAEADKRGLDHTGIRLKDDWIELLKNADKAG
jgi:hypothetical protein